MNVGGPGVANGLSICGVGVGVIPQGSASPGLGLSPDKKSMAARMATVTNNLFVISCDPSESP